MPKVNIKTAVVLFLLTLATAAFAESNSALTKSPPALTQNNPAMQFNVVDINGRPLANAVIELQTATAQVPVPGMLAMDQVSKQFLPEVLVISQGQSVFFPNSDNIRHHVYSFSAAKSFEIKLYAEHPGDPITFDTPGIVVLGCNIHDSMIGYIYVGDSALAEKTDQNGLATLTRPNQLTGLRVWHPQFAATGKPAVLLEPQDLVPSSNNSDNKNNNNRYHITLPFELATDQQPIDEQDKFLQFDLPQDQGE